MLSLIIPTLTIHSSIKKIAFQTATMIVFQFSFKAAAVTAYDTKNPLKHVSPLYLYETCTVIGETKGGLIPYFDCESYTYGVVDTYKLMNKYLPKNQKACFPEKIAPWKILQDNQEFVFNYATQHPRSSAAEALLQAFAVTYPCKENQ